MTTELEARDAVLAAIETHDECLDGTTLGETYIRLLEGLHRAHGVQAYRVSWIDLRNYGRLYATGVDQGAWEMGENLREFVRSIWAATMELETEHEMTGQGR